MRILVIDDSRTIRELSRRTLMRAGYEVVLAEDGKAGIETHRREPCDLVITDLLMPEKEGLETIRELRRFDPKVKIIAVSGGSVLLDKRELLQAAVAFGAARSLTKPFSESALLDTVREVLAGTQPAREKPAPVAKESGATT